MSQKVWIELSYQLFEEKPEGYNDDNIFVGGEDIYQNIWGIVRDASEPTVWVETGRYSGYYTGYDYYKRTVVAVHTVEPDDYGSRDPQFNQYNNDLRGQKYVSSYLDDLSQIPPDLLRGGPGDDELTDSNNLHDVGNGFTGFNWSNALWVSGETVFKSNLRSMFMDTTKYVVGEAAGSQFAQSPSGKVMMRGQGGE